MNRFLILASAILLVALLPGVTFAQPPPPEDHPPVEAPQEAVPADEAPDETPPAPDQAPPVQTEAAREDDAAPSTATEGEQNPCRLTTPPAKDAWIDRVRNRVFRSVCGSAVWFDSLFGHKRVYDSSELYGRVGLGVLYKTSGEYDTPSRFDANIPLPNVSEKSTIFIGRDNEDDYITQRNAALVVPATFLRLSDDQSWLAGLGYTPSNKRLNRFNLRLGAKMSVHPYVFGQARYQYDYYLNARSALRLQEILFYRSSDDGLGLTTRVGYDRLASENFLARISSTASFTQDTEGVKWNTLATLYQDMSRRWGKARGASYQFVVYGETKKDVPIREYGFLAVYREQVFRPWMFANVTLGYTLTREEITDPRKGAVNIGLVLEILFGNLPNEYQP